MDRRTLIALSLCFAIFMGWQKFYLEPRLPQPTTGAPGAVTAPTASTATGVATNPNTKISTLSKPTNPGRPPQTELVAASGGDAIVGNGKDFFVGWNLKSYRLGIAPEAALVDLQSVTHQD